MPFRQQTLRAMLSWVVVNDAFTHSSFWVNTFMAYLTATFCKIKVKWKQIIPKAHGLKHIEKEQITWVNLQNRIRALIWRYLKAGGREYCQKWKISTNLPPFDRSILCLCEAKPVISFGSSLFQVNHRNLNTSKARMRDRLTSKNILGDVTRLFAIF